MSNKMEFGNDPLGFSREVAALLAGLNCSNLKQFKKRNISLDDLKFLTRDDLKILEVGDEFDFESFNRLQQSLLKKHRKIASKPRLHDVLKIVKNELMELKVLRLYVKFTYARLLRNRTDTYIDKNKNLRISEALVTASNCVLQELDELQDAMKAMQINEPKNCNSRRNIITCGIIIGGVGVITLFYIMR